MTPSARIKVSVVGSESKSAIDGSPSACAQGRFAFAEVAWARVSPTHRANSVAEFPYPTPFTAAKGFRGGTFLRLFGGGVGSTGSVDMAFLPQRNRTACSPGTMFKQSINPPPSALPTSVDRPHPEALCR
jgi:hypothetical protein